MPRYPNSSPLVAGQTDRVYASERLTAAIHSFRGRVFRLNVGDTYLEPLPAAQAEAQRTADVPHLHAYAPVRGEPTLLEAIVAHHQGAVADEALQVMAGATAGLAVVCRALLAPGDEVVVLAPFWPLIRGIVTGCGAVPVEVPFHDSQDAAALTRLRAAITPRTAAIYLNSPNNPTGRVMSAQTLDAIADVAVAHDLWVVSDEAYAELSYTMEPVACAWRHPRLRERTIAVHTLSKAFGLAGARVAYAHGPAEIMATVRGVQTYLTYCAPRPMQFCAAAALRHGQAWLADARTRYARAARLAAHALDVPVPHGGTFLFVNVANRLRPGESLDDLLVRCAEAGVLVNHGQACGRDYSSWIRLCFTVVPPDELEQALARLRRVLDG